MKFSYSEFDLSDVNTYPLKSRKSKARAEAQQSRERTEEAYRTAREAVDTSFTHLSENVLLNQPGMQPLRKSLLEDANKRLVRLRPLAEAVALETAMDSAARELVVDAASHHLDDIVER